MSTTFDVDDVPPADKLLPSANTVSKLITKKINITPESCCKLPDNQNLVLMDYTKLHSLVEAVQYAYDMHYPLTLSPDIIWQCVAQGFAIHVNKNAEKLRHMFVAHEGKKEIEVRVDDFLKGSPDNDWERALGDFSEEIRKNVGDEMHTLLTPDFSTTGPVEKAAAQVVLMNTFKEYYSFMCTTSCGIPSVTLEGTVEDWKKLRERTLSLSRFDLQWWTDAVKPVLDEFVDAASGAVDTDFWSKLYKVSNGSGGPYISGWILTLFPYLGFSIESMRPNTYFDAWTQISSCSRPLFTAEGLLSWRPPRMLHGPSTDMFPDGTVCTPFVWNYFGNKFDMYFYAGFVGVAQDKASLALKPLIGWAVVDKEEEEKAKASKRGL